MTEKDLPTIILLDDDGKRVETWAAKLRSVPVVTDGYAPAALKPDAFAAAFEALKRRQRDARDEQHISEQPDDASELDHAEVLIVDFDLTPRDRGTLDDDTWDTLSGSFGDQVSFLARCYSDVTYTVLVNEGFDQSTFDLTHMKFADSNADLNVSHGDLHRVELWTGSSDGSKFRPWSWPRLVDEPMRIAGLVEKVDLDAPVLETLGLHNPDTLDQFTPAQLELFEASGQQPSQVTFRDASEWPRHLRRLSRPEPIPEKYRAKVAVAAVCHWLERIVLPAQNVLIDAPHLAQRRPGLLTSHDPSDWNALCDLSDRAIAPGMFTSDLSVAEGLESQQWLSRPAWLWHLCPRTQVRLPGEPYVFCEDVSGFHPLERVIEYRSSVPGPFDQRFVLGSIEDDGLAINYLPANRLFEA